VTLAVVCPGANAWYVVPEDGPTTVTSSPVFNLNGDEIYKPRKYKYRIDVIISAYILSCSEMLIEY